MSSPKGAEARWQALAADAHKFANEMIDTEARRVMLGIAAAYDRLAERAMAQAKRREKSVTDKRLRILWSPKLDHLRPVSVSDLHRYACATRWCTTVFEKLGRPTGALSAAVAAVGTREVNVEKKAIPVLVAIMVVLVMVWTFFPQMASPPAPVETTQEKNTN